MKNTVLHKMYEDELKNNASEHVAGHLHENTNENIRNCFYNGSSNKLVYHCYSKCIVLGHNTFYSSVLIK